MRGRGPHPKTRRVLDLPARAGLSHVGDEFEHEILIPPGAFELSAHGGFVRVGSGDVEGEAPEDSEIGWSVVLVLLMAVLVLLQSGALSFMVP